MTTNTHLAPRTIREWLELIPFDRARKEAIENFKERDIMFLPNSEDISLSSAIARSFYWDETPQRFEYWSIIFNVIEDMESSVKLKTKQDHGASFGMGY